jgi:rare lipoprotein A (peptidoglycan hydrolase)
VERRVERALLAKVGACAFAWSIALPSALSAATAPTALVATAMQIVPAAITSAPAETSTGLPELRPALFEARAIAIARALALESEPAVAALPPPPEPLVRNGVVLASWYGPGFFGNRTACGQTFGPELVGVAHRTLPCGTKVQITSPAGATVVVPVIDRGPYVAGRSLDLSFATKVSLECSDLCTVRILVLD